MTGIIYKYTSPNGKCYIGQTIKENTRKRQHKLASKDVNTTHPFYKAVQKYGWDNFIYEVLIKFECGNRHTLIKILDHFEIFYIAKYNSYKCGYNQTPGGHLIYRNNDEVGFNINANDYEPLSADFLLGLLTKRKRKLLKQWKKQN